MPGLRLFTTSTALAVPPVPPFVAATAPLTKFLPPAVVAVTSISTLQLASAASVPPANAIVDGAVVVRTPPQTGADPFATASPAGKVPLKARPTRATVGFGLVMVKPSCVEVET